MHSSIYPICVERVCLQPLDLTGHLLAHGTIDLGRADGLTVRSVRHEAGCSANSAAVAAVTKYRAIYAWGRVGGGDCGVSQLPNDVIAAIDLTGAI